MNESMPLQVIDHSLFEVSPRIDAADAGELPAVDGDMVLAVRNVAPACFLRARFAALHSVTLFSATLAPPAHAIQLLGLPANTAWLDVPPAFPPEHLVVQVADGISTRFGDRERSMSRLVSVVETNCGRHRAEGSAIKVRRGYLSSLRSILSDRDVQFDRCTFGR